MKQAEQTKLLFADDMALIADTEKNLQHNFILLKNDRENKYKKNIKNEKPVIVSNNTKKVYEISLASKQIEQIGCDFVLFYISYFNK